MRSPDFDDISGRWFAAMRAGDFAEACRQTDRIESERRAREAAGRFVWEPDYLEWNATPFDDRRVLVRCKHGLGDTLQFIRYVPLLRSRARRVLVMNTRLRRSRYLHTATYCNTHAAGILVRTYFVTGTPTGVVVAT